MIPTPLPAHVSPVLLAHLDAAGMGLGLFDPQDRLWYANAFFRQAFDIDAAQVTTWESMMRHCHAQRVGVLIEQPDFEVWIARVRTRYRSVPVRSFESDFVDGRWMRVIESVDAEGWLLATMADITSLKTNEKALQEARDAAVHQATAEMERTLKRQTELNRLKSNFVAMTSHEFRTPLATILSSGELLKTYGDRLPQAEKDELVTSIETSVSRMTQMLDRVLRISKSDAGMLEFRPVHLDLHSLCQRLLKQAREHMQTPCVWVDDLCDSAVWGAFDENLLSHVVDNLLSNAVKYSPSGGEIRFSLRVSETAIALTVSDSGIGIPAAELPNLFEPFHRARNVGSIQGTGLGMAIVKASVELHGGTMEVSSVEGQGSRFTVRLPIT